MVVPCCTSYRPHPSRKSPPHARPADGPRWKLREQEALMAGGTPALLSESVLNTRHWPGAATPQPKKWEDGELWTARRDSCARTRNAVGNARRFALVPRGKQGGESVMQAQCKSVAWAELRRSYGVAFVFASCSLRILFVFSWCFALFLP